MSINLIRQGQDELGYCGSWSEFSLINLGCQPLYETDLRLSDIHFAFIFTSDLPRELEGTRLVADVCQKEFYIDGQHREINNGDWARLTNEIVEVSYRDLYHNMLS